MCRIMWADVFWCLTGIAELAEKEGITEQLKAQDQLAWVGAMNNIRNAAEEIVLHKVIYS